MDGKSGIVSLEGEPEFKGLKSQIGGRLPKHFDLDKFKTSVRTILLMKSSSLMQEYSVWQMP